MKPSPIRALSLIALVALIFSSAASAQETKLDKKPNVLVFLTGRYHARGGVRGVSTGQERLDLDERTIADTFKASGYATAAFGKWHNGLQSPYHPDDRGFDEYYGFCSGHWGDYFSPPLRHNNDMVS